VSSEQRSPIVRLLVPPGGWPCLDAWGRAGDGWWALLVWLDVVVAPDRPGLSSVLCSGWAPGSAVEPMLPTGRYQQVRRLQLPGHRADWPAPAAEWGGGRWPGPTWHYGQLGGPLRPPLGGWHPGEPPVADDTGS
jgi:hypothetical protein